MTDPHRTATATAPVGADHRRAFYDLFAGLPRLAAARAAVELGIGDHLDGAALTATELAGRCGAQDVAGLERILRSLTAAGWVDIAATGHYTLTPAGSPLSSTSPDSLRAGILVNSDPTTTQATAGLGAALRTGQTALETITGKPFYPWLAGHPDLGATFAEFMVERSAPLAGLLCAEFDFSRARTVVDVGGGNGVILAGILEHHPHLHGVLLDRPELLDTARAHLDSRGVTDRCEVVAGDFFTGVPAGDVYLLASILHNWPGTRAHAILESIAAKIPPDGTLLLADMLLPDHPAHPCFATDFDVRALALHGTGHERTPAQYRALLTDAGYTVTAMTPLPDGSGMPGGFHLITCTRPR